MMGHPHELPVLGGRHDEPPMLARGGGRQEGPTFVTWGVMEEAGEVLVMDRAASRGGDSNNG